MINVQEFQSLWSLECDSPSSYLHYGDTHRRSWIPSLFLVQHFYSSLCFAFAILSALSPQSYSGDWPLRKQTENHVGCQASLSASLSQWMAPGKLEGTWVLWLLPSHDTANMGLASGWWTSGKYWPPDCMVLTQTIVELEAKSEEGATTWSQKGSQGKQLHFQAWNEEHSQSLSLGAQGVLKFWFSVCSWKVTCRNQFSACPLV